MKRLGKKVTIATIFRSPTILELSCVLNADSQQEKAAAIHAFQSSGSKPPFFCAPGFVDLAHRLGEDQPFYGLDLQLLEEMSSVETGFKEYATLCLDEIREVQPHGPYFLGGSAAACLLALEVGHQLEERGEQVGLLAFFDPVPPRDSVPSGFAATLRRYWFHLRKLLRMDGRAQLAYLSDSLGTAFTSMAWRFRSLHDPVARKLGLMESNYRPPSKFGYPIALFLSQDNYLRHHAEEDPRLQWRHVAAGGFDVHEVPGRHSTYMRDPHVEEVAKVLKSYLQDAASKVLASPQSLSLAVVFATPWLALC
jgi:thioesterase domain-containing protein